MKYGIQLYSLRDITPKDMEGALEKTAGIGYRYVEFAGFFGHSAREIRSMLDKYGLEVSGTHTGWQELTPDNFAATVAYHKEIGNKNIIIPGADLSCRAKIDEFIGFVNSVIPKLEKEGIALGYHNHSGEFLPTADGIISHGELETRTNIELEIDTYWNFHAGQDPVQTLERLKDRVRVIHIKDGMRNGEGRPLGMGEAPVAAVYAKAKECGMLMVVESETLKPDGLTEAKICFDYLRSLEK